MIGYLIALVVTGLLVGALGRLAIPGPNPMSIGKTILIGIGGSFIGGLIGRVLFRGGGGIILAVAGAALIVYLLERNAQNRSGGFGRRGDNPFGR